MCGALFSLVPMVAAFLHAWLGGCIAAGLIHIKYAYPAGFLLDISMMHSKLPDSATLPVKPFLMAAGIAMISLSVMANPRTKSTFGSSHKEEDASSLQISKLAGAPAC